MDDTARHSIAPPAAAAARPPPRVRGRLFRKYVALFVAVVCVALLANGAFEIWFSYQDHEASLIRIQREQAQAAAAKIGQFITEIQSQIGWTTELPWSSATLEQRRFDALRLLRQVPAITELSQLDATGKEQLRVSRLEMDAVGPGTDLSHDPRFTEAVAHKVYYGPVYFRRESEPYMTLALAGARQDAGVSVAEVNLKFIWDVVSQIKVGEHGRAFLVDGAGRLIAHPDISLVLRNTNLAHLAQVQAARHAAAGAPDDEAQVARDLSGRRVLSASAAVPPLDWLVFVELPLDEADAPLWGSIARAGGLLALSLVLAVFAALFLARRMVVPIRALQAGAARIGSGDLGQRISITTGDELEALADQFNDMAGRLQESYAGLEQRVEDRTRELTEGLEQQTATATILRVIASSPDDPTRALDTIAETAVRLFDASNVGIRRVEGDWLYFVATAGPARDAIRSKLPKVPLQSSDYFSRSVIENRQFHIADVQADIPDSLTALKEMARELGFRTAAFTPLTQDGKAIGAMGVNRTEVRPFQPNELELMRGFADQAVIAIENARLLAELRARTDELARSVEELRALGEVSQAVNSTLDIETVLTSIVGNAVQLSATDAGAIYVFDESRQDFHLRATHGMDRSLIEAIRESRIDLGVTAIGEAAAQRAPVQVADLRDEPATAITDIILGAGYRALLVVPLLRPDRIVGALVVRRRAPGAFPQATIDLLGTLAAQSVVAIQNARLFSEIEEKGRELAVAGQHKSQFLANMSHELRTPLNAILGYTELILDEIYGATAPKVRDVLERVQANGRHLLGLINDVLDLSKIEAGQLALSLADYSVKDLVQGVFVAVEPLASGKGLALALDVAPGLPTARGDERRLSQVLLNLVGNAIKFTDQGEVRISARAANGSVTVAVRDTGPGIAAADQAKIFEEFQQADNSSTRAKGGTGLGLAISRRIVALHGGRLWVESEPGRGAVFSFTLPVTVERQVGTA